MTNDDEKANAIGELNTPKDEEKVLMCESCNKPMTCAFCEKPAIATLHSAVCIGHKHIGNTAVTEYEFDETKCDTCKLCDSYDE